MIDRLEERLAIRGKLDAMRDNDAKAKADPLVVELRERLTKAQAEARRLQDEFREVLEAARDKHCGHISTIASEHPDLIIVGHEYGREALYALTCAVTGLPILKGDPIVSREMVPDDSQQTVALFGVVDVKAAGVAITVVRADHPDVESEDDADDGDEDDGKVPEHDFLPA